MRILTSSFLAASLLAALGCSSAEPSVPHIGPHGDNTGGGGGGSGGVSGGGGGGTNGGTPDGGSGTPPVTTNGDETWATGKTISGSVNIAAGSTVTIAPGAIVDVASGATITVAGTLKGTSTATHAKLTGTAWGGLVVASGGALTLDGVDLENAASPLAISKGNTSATYNNGTITAASTPFNVSVGGKLSVGHVMVTGTKGMSSIGGAFTASYLSYDSGGNEGIMLTDATTVFTVDDSKFFGTGNTGGDMISSSQAASIHFGHSEISHSHCAFHFNNVTQFDITYATLHDNSYGFMLYGSGSTGTRSVSFSNIFSNADYGADEGSAQAVNGLITIHDGYWAKNGSSTANNINTTTNAITVTNMSTSTPVAGVGPR